MSLDTQYRPDSRYTRGLRDPKGRIFITGQQALVRLLLAQSFSDRAAGIKTAGFVSGYRGSPLGGLDKELWRAKRMLSEAHIRFLPAINEDLAATALIGTQRVEVDPARRYDGVFGMWYGKGPGVDRSGDALRHGNAYGSSPKGGVLVVTGDDHGCVSSSMSHQSDRALIAWGLPLVHPTGVEDYERCGLWGWALSRCSGLWVGFKAITETVEATVSMDITAPTELEMPAIDPGPDGLHWRWPDLPGMQIERRWAYKMEAARIFMRANPLDAVITAPARPRFVLAAVGKAYYDVREALRRSGVSLEQLEHAGVAILRINIIYPLSPLLEAWARRAQTVWVIEEKAPIVEELLKQSLFNVPAERRAGVIGKTDETGRPLLSSVEELRPSRLASILARQLAPTGMSMTVPARWIKSPLPRPAQWLKRTPYMCSGCPHNTSTRIPEGSEARLGIGCHALAARMPDRATSGSVQMGGEGVDWIGQADFVDTPHLFQNIGDGTFFHSGYLAIRQAIASGVNITYKVLYNDAVAMTGGQPVDGRLEVRQIAELVRNEGAREVVVVADDPRRYADAGKLPQGIKLHHRDELETVQKRLRETPGVTVLIYDQVCATEARRRKKRQPAERKIRRIVINDHVCEGCGDCQVQSNCLSVVPIETPFGNKRAIDPSTCNTDLSCLRGYCPSFVTISGVLRNRPREPASAAEILNKAAELTQPRTDLGEEPYEILAVGVGGSGVVTVAATIGLAAHLEGHAVSVLDFTGFAQKGGSVLSHIRMATDRARLHQYRIERASADVMLACDLLVASEDEALATLRPGRSRVIANTSMTQTGAMLHKVDLKIETEEIEQLLRTRVGPDRYHPLHARSLAEQWLSPQQTNMLLLGNAWQRGAIPLSLASLELAIQIQGVDPEGNRLAFALGRLAAAHPAFNPSQRIPQTPPTQPWSPSVAEPASRTLNEIVETRGQFLTQYQNKHYADRYRNLVERVRSAAAAIDDTTLPRTVALNLFKLMAYKDEYEVARLLTSESFLESTRVAFKGSPQLTFHLAPPALAVFRRRRTPLPKIEIPGWIAAPLLRVLAALRGLRHTRWDPFGQLEERRAERQLIHDYEQSLVTLLPRLSHETLPLIQEWAAIPDSIRGYGHIKTRAITAARARQASLMEQILNTERSPCRMEDQTVAGPCSNVAKRA